MRRNGKENLDLLKYLFERPCQVKYQHYAAGEGRDDKKKKENIIQYIKTIWNTCFAYY